MAKPRLIILIRHAQSEGNKKREIHQTIPDHRVKLTQDGWQQAYEAGRRLRSLLRADDTLQFFTSPYRRTRETTEGILATLTADEPDPSPFKREKIKVYEEPRLREQDFGNFQPCSAEMERMWQERADYGHFFYRIPNGESAADAYDRVSGFNESLWRQFGDEDFASVCVLVTHGLMSRVFLMKWYHFSVEYFEDLRNVNHCEFLIMRQREGTGKYDLENKLRTWSELRRERAQHQKEKEKERVEEKDATSGSAVVAARSINGSTSVKSTAPSSSTTSPRRWGGCPDGCNHDKNFKIRSALADLIQQDGTNVYDNPTPATSVHSGQESVKNGTEEPGSTASEADVYLNKKKLLTSSSSTSISSTSIVSRRPNAPRRFQSGGSGDASAADASGTPLVIEPAIDIDRARDEVVSSPDGTPSFISVDVRLRSQVESPNNKPPFLHVGRDFGGTYSGHTSDADSSEDETARSRIARAKLQSQKSSNLSATVTMDPRTKAGASTVDGAADAVKPCCHHGKASIDSAAATATTIGNGTNSTKETKNGDKRDRSIMGRGAYANRLGDAPHCDHHQHDHDHSDPDLQEKQDNETSDSDHNRTAQDWDGDEVEVDAEPEEGQPLGRTLTQAEKEDKSLRGSVY
ncbi:hypothetical protein MCOR07_008571 [Pyricularia oryzae]|uniref:Phosphoglycerate mutase-like protein n=2 Tax=Pyricularia TaxID=48558 RepID=A0ABQ8N799_PYRGI|nr:hypothetical protein MCOR01_006405 [Pyricularia oryzae]KAI6292441.1 hypothetical protein MCOR33_009870 [Pyricularia grisea]KAI6258581.1 hypothetical protein MCOR19_005038 [Pyricularia oryzae]KAI6265306.1 hypothetical protein MCOR26_010806 [Pyricularia oryzae]KAI6361021.1 hypothetical protein MCOR31_008872 [Pyricularia oryzae]